MSLAMLRAPSGGLWWWLDAHKFLVESGEVMEFKDFLSKQLQVAHEYESSFELRLQKSGRNRETAVADDFIFKVRSGNRMFYLDLPRGGGLNSSFLHTKSCKDSLAQRDKLDRSFAIQRLARRVVENSMEVREALDTYGGFWWEYLSAVSLDDKEMSGAPIRGMRSEVGYLEARVPGVFATIRRIGLNPFYRVKLPVDRFGRGSRNRSLLSNLAWQRHSAIFSALLRAISDYRRSCGHPTQVSCVVCGRLAVPDIFRAASDSLHPETCAWCVHLIARTEKVPSFFRGVDKSAQKRVFESALARLDELTDFHYWRTPFISHRVLRSLRIGFLPREAAAELSIVLACMPKKEVVGRLYENKEAIILGAGLTNRFPTGGGRGVRTIASDGHLCLSYGERDICEFLSDRAIPHSREPLYADLVPECADFGASRGDFLIERTVYEFAGLSGSPAYDRKLEKKILLASRFGLDVRVITPSDLNRLSEVFKAHLH